MDTSTKAKITFDGVPKDNQALAAEIHDFVQSRYGTSTLSRGNNHKEPDETQLKSLLERLYIHMTDFGRYRGNAATPDAKIIAAWESFLDPIGALAHIKPHGHMMAARMLLYLTNAFIESHQMTRNFPHSVSSSKPIALRCNLLVALDDALLSHLTDIWRHSDKRELFSWVFAEYDVQDGCAHRFYLPYVSEMCPQVSREQRRIDRFKAACVTRPSDLTPENGLRPHWKWTRPPGDTKHYPLHPDCRLAGFEVFLYERRVMWQHIGSVGPIRGSYYYSLFNEDSALAHPETRVRHTLRRSRQFVLDTRKIAMPNLARDRHRLAEIAMARSPLPLELQFQVLGYLEDIPPEHPYLSKFDLAVAYQPFPGIGKKCTECPSRGNKAADKMVRATCPQKTITIWNLPLRMFHKYHLNNRGNWTLCTHSDCNGHHRDASWSFPSQGVELEDHLNGLLQGRCGPATTITDIGLGPLDPVALPTEREDSARIQRLFSVGQLDYERDSQDENLWIGINGLVDVMLHDRTLLGVDPSGSVRTTGESHWMLGRTRQDEQRVCSALKHSSPNCAYC